MMMMMMMMMCVFLRVADRRIREGVLQDHAGFPRFFKVSSVHVDFCGVVVMQIVSTSVTVFSALPAAEACHLCFLFLFFLPAAVMTIRATELLLMLYTGQSKHESYQQ